MWQEYCRLVWKEDSGGNVFENLKIFSAAANES